MAGRSYTNFDLLIEPAGKCYRARVLKSGAGEALVEFKLPFSEDRLENLLIKMGQRPRSGVRHVRPEDSPELAAAKDFGAGLFAAVFSRDVYARLLESLEKARASEQGLRVLLRLPPELASLPWECLYNPDWNRFLALSLDTPLVRYLEVTPVLAPLALRPPLRILAVISGPSDYDPLDVEGEWRDLQTALEPLRAAGWVTLERLDAPTLAALRRQLRRGGDYHIFHFIGHGAFNPARRDGRLVFCDEKGRGQLVSGQELGTILHNYPGLRLALLNACDGARTSQDDPFGGVAPTLVQMGLPAVIAMQTEISDQAALSFAEEFYAALADGYAVDAALTEARTALFSSRGGVEWGTPVLFTRSLDGRVFELLSREERPPSPVERGEEIITPLPFGSAKREEREQTQSLPGENPAGGTAGGTGSSPTGAYGAELITSPPAPPLKGRGAEVGLPTAEKPAQDADRPPKNPPVISNPTRETSINLVTAQPAGETVGGPVLIVAVDRSEVRALLRAFGVTAQAARRMVAGRIYYALGASGGRPVYLVQSETGIATPGGALLTVALAIQDLKPTALILCGTAYGLRPDEQRVGDILVASQLHYYEPQKIDLEHGQIPRGDRVAASEKLLQQFRSAELDWDGASLHFGLVLAGEKLVRDPAWRAWLLKYEPEALGGESEGAGLYTAAHSAKVDWIVVKAIRDWAEGEPEPGAQEQAADNAARFVRYALGLGAEGGTAPDEEEHPLLADSHPAETDARRPGPDSFNRSLAEAVSIPIPTMPSADFQRTFLDLWRQNPGKARQWTLTTLTAHADDPQRRRTLTALAQVDPAALGGEVAALLVRLLADEHETVPLRAGAALALPKLISNPAAEVWQALQSARQPQIDFELKSAVTWAWCEFGRFEELGLVKVPAGEFLMGSDRTVDPEAYDDELPQHRLHLPTFYIGRCPVTGAEWRAYLEASGQKPRNASSLTGSRDHPVVWVAWDEALAYARWYGLNLPSEAEWEKAARGADGRIYPWGSAALDRNRCNIDNWFGGTTRVGRFSPNGDSPYGCTDMIGNVWEWTRSQFKPYPYDPRDGCEDLRPGPLRAVRGAAFDLNRWIARCAFRNVSILISGGDPGFRVVCAPPSSTSEP